VSGADSAITRQVPTGTRESLELGGIRMRLAKASSDRTLLTAATVLSAAVAFAQQVTISPVRAAPTEKLTVTPGFRDWGPTTIVGTTILAGNMTNRGGVFAIDAISGKVKWTVRPTFNSGTAAVSTAPAVAGDIVITPFSMAYPGAVIAVSLAGGKEIWRGPDPAVDAAVAVSGGVAFVLGKDGRFSALDAATGRERWKVALASRGECASRPIVRDDVVYLTSGAAATAGDATKPAGVNLFALDANTGQERWRYRAEAPYVHGGVCLRQPIVSADTIFASGENRLYAIDRATGRDRWAPVEVRRLDGGRERAVEVHGLVDADTLLIGMTSGFLIAFDKATGRTAWEIAGEYPTNSPATAVAGNVLYFQGSPVVKPGPARGTLHALDLSTRTILWSFSRPTAEPNWPFGFVTTVDGALWVDSYQALVKLQ
jgi:eukaryotic-like serine/threonine-protein kinase